MEAVHHAMALTHLLLAVNIQTLKGDCFEVVKPWAISNYQSLVQHMEENLVVFIGKHSAIRVSM